MWLEKSHALKEVFCALQPSADDALQHSQRSLSILTRYGGSRHSPVSRTKRQSLILTSAFIKYTYCLKNDKRNLVQVSDLCIGIHTYIYYEEEEDEEEDDDEEDEEKERKEEKTRGKRGKRRQLREGCVDWRRVVRLSTDMFQLLLLTFFRRCQHNDRSTHR